MLDASPHMRRTGCAGQTPRLAVAASLAGRAEISPKQDKDAAQAPTACVPELAPRGAQSCGPSPPSAFLSPRHPP